MSNAASDPAASDPGLGSLWYKIYFSHASITINKTNGAIGSDMIADYVSIGDHVSRSKHPVPVEDRLL